MPRLVYRDGHPMHPSLTSTMHPRWAGGRNTLYPEWSEGMNGENSLSGDANESSARGQRLNSRCRIERLAHLHALVAPPECLRHRPRKEPLARVVAVDRDGAVLGGQGHGL